MIDERRHAAAPCHEPFADDIDVVDVQVRHVGDERIGRVIVRQPDVLAVEPLEGAVGADVHDGIGAKALAEPGVGGHVLMVRSQILGVVHLLAVLAPAARWLRKQRDLPELHRRNDQASIGGHQA